MSWTAATSGQRRLAAAVIALVAAASLLAQCVVTWRALGAGAAPLALIWTLSGYFTVMTNLLVCPAFAAEAFGLHRIGAALAGALTLSIALVGVVYHLLLAGLWAPQGLAWWADQGLHTLVPVLVVLFWLALAPKRELGTGAPLLWLLWPLTYAGYAMLRGGLTGWYAYPFLDLNTLGVATVLRNMAGLLVMLLLAGYGMLALARRRRADKATE